MAYIVPSVKNQDKRDMDGIIGNVNENKTKCNSFLLQKNTKTGSRCCVQNLERESVISL